MVTKHSLPFWGRQELHPSSCRSSCPSLYLICYCRFILFQCVCYGWMVIQPSVSGLFTFLLCKNYEGSDLCSVLTWRRDGVTCPRLPDTFSTCHTNSYIETVRSCKTICSKLHEQYLLTHRIGKSKACNEQSSTLWVWLSWSSFPKMLHAMSKLTPLFHR